MIEDEDEDEAESEVSHDILTRSLCIKDDLIT